MARKEKLSEADTLDTKSFEDPALYQDAEGKGAVLQTLDAAPSGGTRYCL